ncbi:peptide-methionine (S)-S-oxide reductase MsrA [Salinarimonas ramus]|uniref:Peptide methionine sulfoxide reductase MsrA n=1 Tax=Salinarimonas ramus TaxID=690164 RepID=A0A917Q6J3_9HYPH|nr:peptide-methionine (S)-S-oxide reductase MsrA [Salinarimonas ramus]GGK29671.1 peptide methionine sulfoxide reductase MsrA [Salinarimonas ramus]
MTRTILAALAATTMLAAPAAAQDADETARAVFGGGCFWCVEADFDKVPGVLETTSGYIGGALENPTYEQVSSEETGHAEAVEIVYDPDRVSYEELLHVFWRTHDPLTGGAQFCDVGSSYRPVIFPLDAEQERLAEASKEAVAARFDEPIETTIEEPTTFWPAEEYHQDYYEKNPVAYRFYRWNCGRDARVEALWGEEAGGLGIFEDAS